MWLQRKLLKNIGFFRTHWRRVYTDHVHYCIDTGQRKLCVVLQEMNHANCRVYCCCYLGHVTDYVVWLRLLRPVRFTIHPFVRPFARWPLRLTICPSSVHVRRTNCIRRGHYTVWAPDGQYLCRSLTSFVFVNLSLVRHASVTVQLRLLFEQHWMIDTIQGAATSNPLRGFFAVFSATVWNKPYWHLGRYSWFTCEQTVVHSVKKK